MNQGSGAPAELVDYEPTAADFRAEVLAGLRTRPRSLPCKYLYDGRGSRLFDRICELPEYYPTRTEIGILSTHQSAIARRCGGECLLVELGSGSGTKTRLLLDALDRPAGYVPIDISRSHLLQSAAAIAEEYPRLPILPVCADYAQPLRVPKPDRPVRRTLVFFPGSTIGNFEPAAATRFLSRVAAWCHRGDQLLIGVDLEKDRRVLEAAYNDASGVTAAFNLNLLTRANEELGADFALDRFRHEAIYNAAEKRVEMHLVSTCAQDVRIGTERFSFQEGGRIVTEYSYKYPPEEFERLAHSAGWTTLDRWMDPRGWFGVFMFDVR